MANFIAIVDANPDRRSHFLQAIAEQLSPVEGLLTRQATCGDLAVAWAAHPQAPISQLIHDQSLTLVWGTAFSPETPQPLAAQDLKQLWQTSALTQCPALDGYYAALTYDQQAYDQQAYDQQAYDQQAYDQQAYDQQGLGQHRLVVGADLLGTFPIYYYRDSEITLVGSSPELFKKHPCFQARFNPVGLVGVLLTNGLTQGQTLWQQVYRLAPGHLLLVTANQPEREIQHYQIPEGDLSYAHLKFDDQVALLHETLAQAIAQQLVGIKHSTLLLSGGLDSRTLAGYLSQQGHSPQALTLGRPSDLEAHCAQAVSQRLGFEHQVMDIPETAVWQQGNQVAQWEHLANGFSFSTGWALAPQLKTDRVIAGYSLDLILGGPVPDRLFLNPTPFSTFFARGVSAWGLSPTTLQALLNPDLFGDAIATVMDKLAYQYESYAENTFRRALRFKLHHRQRHHIGGSAWRLSFGAWPILPFLNQRLLAVSAALSPATLDSRQAQQALLKRCFPALAQLPLDRNSYNIAPLQPGPWRQRLAPLFEVPSQWRRLQKRLGWERRYYYRAFDIHHLGWQHLREQAEEMRAEITPHCFQPTVFNALLPPTPHPIPSQNTLSGSGGIRNLIGFMIWADQHL